MVALDLHTINHLDYNTDLVRYDPNHLTLREKAVKQAALELGVQTGLYFGQQEINERLDQIRAMLYQVYNFNTLLLSRNIMPPVIETGYNQSNVSANEREVQLNGQVYKIVKQAYFVSNVPTWRDYLITNVVKPDPPDKSILPKNDAEKKIWQETIRKAWETGVEQSVEIFKQNLYRLKRDFSGMVMYYELLNRNMVVLPYVKEASKAIVNKTNYLAIDNRNYQLSVEPQFQGNSKNWRALLNGTFQSSKPVKDDHSDDKH
ncbi:MULTISPECIES: type IV secretory system conjugative DNA transfer family protein [Cysteiniphilum]|uniref:type IV secretory system conjugative DNA transfer family protein n=1 Tax=Cysteiniphilum TaxID=2056696 RepID=UPI00177FF2B8|nr:MULTISPECIES: type IV secretory system conjugative DNA transfer family protein [Cysteiniphilum]